MQVLHTNSLGGYMWSPNLSRKLRTALQPMVRFRQFCDAKEAFGTGVGEYFNWNVYSDVEDEGRSLAETETMPTDACQWFYDCKGCRAVLKPKPGDCCVYCSYGTVACPPIQQGGSCCG